MKKVIPFLFLIVMFPLLQGCDMLLVAFNIKSQAREAEVQATKHLLQSVKQSCQSYRLYYKEYPTSWDQLIHTPNDRSILDAVPVDLWNNPLVLKNDSKTLTITSIGPDGKPDTDDDISESIVIPEIPAE